jgi:acetyl coenzyme A synthetase (ADP forming)-like protein
VVTNSSLYKAEAILQDGSSIHIRALHPGDKTLLLELFSHLSQRSVYLRFFRAKTWLSDGELDEFTNLDFVTNVALAAILREGGREHVIGVGRYTEVKEAVPRRAEVAFAVADGHHGRGIGTLLLEHLVSIARTKGITEFEADVLGENNRMLKVFADSGFRVKRALDSGVIHVSFPTEATDEAAEAQQRREGHAAAQSVQAFLNPRSVAVIGASRQTGSIGAALVANLKQCGFTGTIYPVNPKAGEIDGLKAYPGIAAIGQPVDMALISVPAAMVEQAVRDCANAGVRSVVIISSGFGEVSPAGREIEKRMRELVRASGMRMVGPNCMGILNTDPAISLNATFVPSWPPAGNIGVLSQSGALGYVILNHIQNLNVGVSTFVSVGNKADVSGNDLLSYWAEDPTTKVIVLYLESFGNPRKFARIAPEIARDKPIVAIKAGRSSAGKRAASSHSAALASLEVAVDALFEQAGVIRVNTLEELMDVAILLSSQPIPEGPRVGIITNGGGPGIILADACEAHGLTLPELSPQTQEQLRPLLPPQANLANPVDMIASATGEQYATAIRLMGADPNIDALIVIYIPPQLHPPEEAASAIARAAGDVPPGKPVLTVFMWPKGAPRHLSTGPRGRLPSYGFPENAAVALSAAERYGRWRRRPRGGMLALEPFARAAIRAVIDRVLASDSGPVWLEPADLATILRAAGIEFAATEQVRVDDALITAERMGYPLVLKVQSDRVIHKSDVGGVITGLNSRQEVAAALDMLAQHMQRIEVALEKVLLQREIHGGIEALVGVTTDPTFGPLVVCGLGGVLVEVLKDVSFRLTPVSDVDAEEMIARLHSGRLLDGYRGAAPGDRKALVRTIQQVSALVELIPELRELDLNPVIVLEPGKGAVAVDGRMRIAPI